MRPDLNPTYRFQIRIVFSHSNGLQKGSRKRQRRPSLPTWLTRHKQHQRKTLTAHRAQKYLADSFLDTIGPRATETRPSTGTYPLLQPGDRAAHSALEAPIAPRETHRGPQFDLSPTRPSPRFPRGHPFRPRFCFRPRPPLPTADRFTHYVPSKRKPRAQGALRKEKETRVPADRLCISQTYRHSLTSPTGLAISENL